jgi:hypothetical protein
MTSLLDIERLSKYALKADRFSSLVQQLAWVSKQLETRLPLLCLSKHFLVPTFCVGMHILAELTSVALG